MKAVAVAWWRVVVALVLLLRAEARALPCRFGRHDDTRWGFCARCGRYS